MTRIRAAALLGASVLAAPAAAEPRQWGNVVYDLPPGWSQGRAEDGVQVLLFDGDEEVCPYCSLSIGPGAPASGDLATWLRGQSLAFVEEEDRGSVEIVSGPELVDSAGRTIAMMGQRVDSDLQVLFAFEAGQRFELIGFEGWAYDEEEATRTLGYLGSGVTPIIEGVAFVSDGAEPLLPEPVAGSLDGLWWGWNQGFSLGLDGMMMPTTEFRTLAFWPDGLFVEGTPPAGLAPTSVKALSRSGLPDWGTYREEGGAVVLTFADGRTERLDRAGEALTDESRTLARVEPLADGATLDGRVEDFSYVALGPVGGDVSGGVANESTTVFHPDGTWEGTRFGAASATFSQGGTVTGGFTTDGGEEASAGTYEVRDGLLLMTPADGSAPTASLAFVNADGDTMVGELFLETD